MQHRRLSVAAQVFIGQLVLLTALIGVAATFAVLDVRETADLVIADRAELVAVTVAQSPSTVAGVRAPDPTAELQPVAERVRHDTGMDFVVVMAPDRTRYTHPRPDRIGRPFRGTIGPALAGETFTETYTGTLGPSVRAVTPVRAEGEVIALVSVGVTRARIGREVTDRLLQVSAMAAGGLAVAVLSSFLLSRRLRRQTHGLAPDELRMLYEHHDAVLHSINEGLLVFGTGQDRAEVVNDEARRLLELPEGPIHWDALPASLRGIADGPVRDEMHVTGGRVLLVNQDVVTWDGRAIGTVLTLRDRTELREVLGELDSLRGFAESLRSQAHEADNRLHTVITLVELGRAEEAVDFATAELQLSQTLIDRLLTDLGDPVLAALLLGKIDQAAERGVALQITSDTGLDSSAPLSPHETVTLVGNLVDNAIDAAAGTRGAWVTVTVRRDAEDLLVCVADSGDGMPEELFARAAERGYSTKSGHGGLGLALVYRVVSRHRGVISTTTTPHAAVVIHIPPPAPGTAPPTIEADPA